VNKRNLKHQSRTDWDRIDKMKDDEIDYSDIPELDDTFFKNAKLSMPRHKDSVTLRIDHDVLEWFKKLGKGYQTKINAVLKTFVRASHHN
jgi:uncharacterized protein (DUF4415 family)